MRPALDKVPFFRPLSLSDSNDRLSTGMRRAIAKRILRVAVNLTNSHISFDDFIEDVTHSHIGLLKATDDLKSVISLLARSGHPEPAERLEVVQKDIDFALETMRTLDALYSRGKLRAGPRAPQVHRFKPAEDMEAAQEKPSLDRTTRKLLR